MSDIAKLIEALRLSQAGGTRSGEDNPILPLDQPLVVVDGKLMRAADAPKPTDEAAAKPAASSSPAHAAPAAQHAPPKDDKK